MQLEEALPVPTWLHWSTLPVSTPADAASSGSERQQTARLPHIFEARWPQTHRAVRWRTHPVDANTLGFNPTNTSRAPLIRRYLSFATVNAKIIICLWYITPNPNPTFSLFSVQINVRVHHTPDTSVVIQPLDQSDVKPPHKTGTRPILTRHKPKGRCFQETTPKQAVSLVTWCSDGCWGWKFHWFSSILSHRFSATALRFLSWPIRRIAVVVWGIHGDKTSVTSAPNCQVSYCALQEISSAFKCCLTAYSSSSNPLSPVL